MTKYYLPHSTTCFICGEANHIGLKCRFYTDKEGIVYLDPVIRKDYAGFTNVIHGGIQSAILDEAMGWCGFTQTEAEQLFYTRELKVKFSKNVLPMAPILVRCEITDTKRDFVYVKGTIKDDSGTLLTSATGIFVPIPPKMMELTANAMKYINDGRTYNEKAMRICKPTPAELPVNC